MLVSIFKLGVWKADKRTRRELWSSQEHNKEQIPNISHGIQRKWPFMDASKESFEFEVKKKCNYLVKMKSSSFKRSTRGPAGKHRWLKPNSAQTQPQEAPSLKRLWLPLMEASQTCQGREQEAAGRAEMNEEAQNEKGQQLETLAVTSGTEPETTTLLSHLLRHYN